MSKGDSKRQLNHKRRAVLLPMFSLPSATGIGCFSKEAFAFIDFLEKAGQDAWQILPLGPIDQWHSPYQPCSAFAGEPLFIDKKMPSMAEIDAYSEEILCRMKQCREVYEEMMEDKKHA